ncbi:probable LRR receptor-like serine/threonine-protein kinase At3g47570 [Citrus sinensis]|uniref:probable LRR receptor-like serine/threonine-protein kinase At3g47570 n=1 Tax=Citrus clementina TaxID=85681 RepID=UPI000CED3DCE|nr:probable LRR receptor-like serine/threonine-protein kinase At3g47570 [Citrus x clementina]XP_052287301.1 probable LRR receptor-like serine/threonine-protein kinase At3g47570 [Citrus sinensis]
MAFGFNKLVGVVPATIFNVSTLKSLYLYSNSLSGRLPSSADIQLPNLEELILWGNNFCGTIPSFIFNASKLSTLELQKNSFSGFIPNTFGNLRNLKRLGLNDNYLTSSTPELSFLSSLSNCKYLEYFSFSSNPLGGILPRAIGNLSQSIEVIGMFNCNISGSIPEEINNLTNLIAIYLGGNKLNGSISIALGKLQKLQLLGLEDNQLEGSIPYDLCRLAALFQLDLGDNKLSGFVPSCFGNLTNLRKLYLGSNQLTYIPLTLWNLKYILYLNLSSNSFTIPLPSEIGNLEVLVQIDLSMNNFSGAIPTTIGGLKDLQYLFLEYNRLQGSIPDFIGGLINLKSLDLSNNNLSGAIPISLEKLLDLQHINVSFNKLEGEIPREGPFRNFSIESFKGNELLCGMPNLHVPPCRTGIHHTSRKNDLLIGIVLPLSTIFMMVVILLILRYRKRGKPLLNDANMPPLANQRRFTYLELFHATNGFSANNIIGRGGIGSIYKARIQDGMEVAVKVFDLQYREAFKSFDNECDMMKLIRHRNLIKIISSCSNDDFKALLWNICTLVIQSQ